MTIPETMQHYSEIWQAAHAVVMKMLETMVVKSEVFAMTKFFFERALEEDRERRRNEAMMLALGSRTNLGMPWPAGGAYAPETPKPPDWLAEELQTKT